MHTPFHFKKRSLLLWLGLMAIGSIPLAKVWIDRDTAGRIYTSAETIPHQKVGLVLGCNQNLYFDFRLDAAVELFQAGKIDFILVSGDNHVATYDESTAMKQELIRRGIPVNRIVCDFAGFSTLDSIVRANKVFGQKQLTIISQSFHVKRALFIAKRKQIDAVGYCAREVEQGLHTPTQLREMLARVKTVLDLYVLHRRPRFYGEPIPIGPTAPVKTTRKPTEKTRAL